MGKNKKVSHVPVTIVVIVHARQIFFTSSDEIFGIKK